MPKGIPNNRYSGELKQKVVEAMINEKLSYQEAARRFEIAGHEAFQKISDNTGLLLHPIKARLKGLPPALHRQQALSAA